MVKAQHLSLSLLLISNANNNDNIMIKFMTKIKDLGSIFTVMTCALCLHKLW